MAHTSCYNKHSMWNGDGKPVVYAYRIGFLVEYMNRHPDFKLCVPTTENEYGYDIFDVEDKLADEFPKDSLDIWYCDECGCLAIFYSDSRADYTPIKDLSQISYEDIKEWTDYIACREMEFEEFQDYYEEMNPVDAAMNFQFKYRYKVSVDMKYIYGYDSNYNIVHGFELKQDRVLKTDVRF